MKCPKVRGEVHPDEILGSREARRGTQDTQFKEGLALRSSRP